MKTVAFLLAGILVFVIYSVSSIVLPGNIFKIIDVNAIPLVDEFVDAEIKNTNTTTSSNSQTADHVPQFFAIQHAQSGSLSKINETASSLELNDVSDKTILFSDRPDRIVTSSSTSDFIGNWSIGQDSFAVDAPNAVLVVDVQGGIQDVAIVELFTPVYDSQKMILKYDVTPDNATSIDLPSEFGQTTIVIDGDSSTTYKIDVDNSDSTGDTSLYQEPPTFQEPPSN